MCVKWTTEDLVNHVRKKGGKVKADMWPNLQPEKPKKRLRQSGKGMNKLEREWLSELTRMFPGQRIYSQSWRVRIANGAWFKVDFCAFIYGQWTAWECKGPKEGKNVDRGVLALKCAAAAFPEVKWILAWKDAGVWQQQEVLS